MSARRTANERAAPNHRAARFATPPSLALVSLLALACGPASPAPVQPCPEPAPGAGSSTEPSASAAATATCLPLVHGCGCAYDCALLLGDAPDEVGRVLVQPTSGGAPLVAERTSWCDGQAFACATGRPGFYDRTPCGGECIPTRAFDGCHLENGLCVQ